ncbi:hypothetical protein [Nostoc sp.]
MSDSCSDRSIAIALNHSLDVTLPSDRSLQNFSNKSGISLFTNDLGLL